MGRVGLTWLHIQDVKWAGLLRLGMAQAPDTVGQRAKSRGIAQDGMASGPVGPA